MYTVNSYTMSLTPLNWVNLTLSIEPRHSESFCGFDGSKNTVEQAASQILGSVCQDCLKAKYTSLSQEWLLA